MESQLVVGVIAATAPSNATTNAAPRTINWTSHGHRDHASLLSAAHWAADRQARARRRHRRRKTNIQIVKVDSAQPMARTPAVSAWTALVASISSVSKTPQPIDASIQNIRQSSRM